MPKLFGGLGLGILLGGLAVGVLTAQGDPEGKTRNFKTPCEIVVELDSAKSVAGDCCGNDGWRTRFYYNPVRVYFDEMRVDIDLTAEARERDPSSDDIGRQTETISMNCKPNEVETRSVTIDVIACEGGPAFGPCESREETETWRFEFTVTAEGPVTEEAFKERKE